MNVHLVSKCYKTVTTQLGRKLMINISFHFSVLKAHHHGVSRSWRPHRNENAARAAATVDAGGRCVALRCVALRSIHFFHRFCNSCAFNSIQMIQSTK